MVIPDMSIDHIHVSHLEDRVAIASGMHTTHSLIRLTAEPNPSQSRAFFPPAQTFSLHWPICHLPPIFLARYLNELASVTQ